MCSRVEQTVSRLWRTCSLRGGWWLDEGWGKRGVDVPVGSTKPTSPGTAVFPDWQQLVGMNRAKELETPKQVGDEGCARKADFK